jgi:hypothetical protein
MPVMLNDMRLAARIGCPACETDAFARNAWFDGKVITAVDLVAEQDYFLTKHRRHDRLLHGWGVVCGLRVRQHPNPACRSQYVVIEPGSAIDCCGREVRVDQPTLFDYRTAYVAAYQAANGPNAQPGAGAHRVEIVLRYQECPAEPVPVLFQGCAPAGESCLPNRVVEGFDLGLLLNRPPPDPDTAGAALSWSKTIGADGAMRVRVEAASARAFVLAAEPAATLLVVDLATGATLATMADAAFAPLDLAVSPDGAFVFVALSGGGGAEIRVLSAAKPADPPLHVLALNGVAANGAHLYSLADGRLAASVPDANEVRIWGADITGAAAPAAPAVIAVANGPAAIAAPDPAVFLYVAESAAAEVTAIRLSDLTTVALPIAAPPAALAASRHAGQDMLAVLDGAANAVRLIAANPAAANAADQVKPLGDPLTGFAFPPTDVVLSPGGGWLAALLRGVDGKGYVQAASVARVVDKAPGALGVQSPIGPDPQALIARPDGTGLLAAFAGADPEKGGVAIVDAANGDCRGCLEEPEECPDCGPGDELVLATIDAYHFNDAVDDTGLDAGPRRRAVASTTALQKALLCVMDSFAGAQGPKGDTGPQGAPGRWPKLALPRIVAINWLHDDQFGSKTNTKAFRQFINNGLIVAFDPNSPVQADTFNLHTVQVWRGAKEPPPQGSSLSTIAWTQIDGQLTGIPGLKPSDLAQPPPASGDQTTGPVTGLRFLPGSGGPKASWDSGVYRVVIEGNFILGQTQIAVPDPLDPTQTIMVNPGLDAEHFGPGLPGRGPTGNGLEGGRFFSWFEIV